MRRARRSTAVAAGRRDAMGGTESKGRGVSPPQSTKVGCRDVSCFLAALILAAMIFGLARLFGSQVTFEGIFKVIASVLAMLPIVAMMFMLCIAVAMGLSLVVGGVLEVTGLFPTVEGWSFGNGFHHGFGWS